MSCVVFVLSVHTSKGPAFKKPKKKKVLKQQPKQKSGFKLKTTKKPWTFSHHAAKPKPNKPLPKLKHKPLPKSKPIPKPKTKAYSQHQSPSRYRPGTSRPKPQPQVQSRLGSKSRRTTSQKQHLSRLVSPRPKSKTQLRLHLKSISRRMLPQYQNTSLPQTSHPMPSQPLWDTSVQAAIRVGDWKLLTGDPGHGDWVPPQVLLDSFYSDYFNSNCS